MNGIRGETSKTWQADGTKKGRKEGEVKLAGTVTAQGGDMEEGSSGLVGE